MYEFYCIYIMAENSFVDNNDTQLPVPAVFIDGKGGAKVLLDPQGFKLAYKKTNCSRRFYYCAERKKTGCPV